MVHYDIDVVNLTRFSVTQQWLTFIKCFNNKHQKGTVGIINMVKIVFIILSQAWLIATACNDICSYQTILFLTYLFNRKYFPKGFK